MSLETLTKKQLVDIIKELKKKTSLIEHNLEEVSEEADKMQNEACGIYKDSNGKTHMVLIRFDEKTKKACIVEDTVMAPHLAENQAIRYLVRTNRGLNV